MFFMYYSFSKNIGIRMIESYELIIYIFLREWYSTNYYIIFYEVYVSRHFDFS